MQGICTEEDYQREDALYRSWLAAQRAAKYPSDLAESLAFQAYEARRNLNRLAERAALNGKPFSAISQAYVDHCGQIPLDKDAVGWHSSGPTFVRWWDQGSTILDVLRDLGRPLGVDSALPIAASQS